MVDTAEPASYVEEAADRARRMTGAAALMAALQAHNVGSVFGIPSTHTLEIYRTLGEATDIRHITTTHEQGAAFMADGYARGSGRPGVCFITTGPGVTNAATALAQAYSDSVPVLCITAHIISTDIGRGRGHSHELRSQESVLAGVTEESYLLKTPGEVPRAVAEAFRSFRTKRPRPICLAIPTDVQEASASVSITQPTADEVTQPDTDAVAEAVALLAASSTPALLVGGGTVNAADNVVELAAHLDAPVVTTLNGKGVIPGAHRLAASLPGYGSVVRFLEECDVVLAVGTELSPSDLWTVPLRLRGKLIHVDIDGSQIGLNHPVDVPIVGDAATTLDLLRSAVPPGSRDGAARATAVRDAATEEGLVMGRPYLPWIRALRKAMPAESALSLDVALVTGFGCFPFYDLPKPRTWLNPTGLGTLGYALPAAIGAKIASPDRPVAALTGDGGFMFTMSELMVAVQQGLSLPIVVWNNRAYGEIDRLMRERGYEPFATELHTPDLTTLASAYGAASSRVKEPEELASAVSRAFETAGPTLLEIPDWT